MALTVLHVDDDASFQRMVVRVLSHAVPVTSAGSVAAGLAALEESGDWLAFIIDLSLPDGSGWAIVERAQILYPSIPCLVLTGMFTLEVFHRAQTERATYLEKSGPIHSLIAWVENVKSQRSAVADAIHSTIRTIAAHYSLTAVEALVLESELSGLHPTQLLDGRTILESTRKTHRTHIRTKLGIPNGIQAEDWSDLKRILLRDIIRPQSECAGNRDGAPTHRTKIC